MRMHSIKILALCLILFACKSRLPNAYDYTPVLLHLDKYNQHDTLGFNLATEIPKLLYSRILSEDIALWASPSKQIKIDKEDFLRMEKSASVPFVESQHFFIHEVWRIYKRNFNFGVLGFSFTGESRTGRKINYGYVDANDVILLMRSRNIPSNANGSSDLSYWDALHSMNFDFDLVQFGKEDFKENLIRSFQLEDQALKNPKIRRKLTTIPKKKRIEYRILNPKLNSNPENKILYNAFEQFVNDNKQIILNAGGSDFLSHLMFVDWKIDQVVVTEQWTRFNKLPFQELQQIQLFIEGKPIGLLRADLEELDVKIKLQGVEEYLSGKEFSFNLLKINDQEIQPQESDDFYRALWENDWNKLSNKYDKN